MRPRKVRSPPDDAFHCCCVTGWVWAVDDWACVLYTRTFPLRECSSTTKRSSLCPLAFGFSLRDTPFAYLVYGVSDSWQSQVCWLLNQFSLYSTGPLSYMPSGWEAQGIWLRTSSCMDTHFSFLRHLQANVCGKSVGSSCSFGRSHQSTLQRGSPCERACDVTEPTWVTAL